MTLCVLLLVQLTSFRYSQVRVRFDGEDGSGPGVNRGFFAAFANALKASDKVMLVLLWALVGK